MQHRIKGGIRIAYDQAISSYTLEASIVNSEFCKVKGPRLHIGTERYQLLTRSFKEREELVMVASKIGVDVAEQLGSSLNPRMDFVRYIPIEELLLDSLVRESLVRRINDKPKSNETE